MWQRVSPVPVQMWQGDHRSDARQRAVSEAALGLRGAAELRRPRGEVRHDEAGRSDPRVEARQAAVPVGAKPGMTCIVPAPCEYL